MLKYYKAARAALHNSTNTQKVFAVAEAKGRKVAQATNQYTRSHARQRDYARRAGFPNKVYLHAEIGALVKSRCPVDTMYIYRLNRRGDMLPSKPCAVCQLALKELKIKQVYK